MMSNIHPEFWSGKRVFLTGHTGFKGSWLSLWLQSMGVELFGFSLQTPTTPALFDEAKVHKNMATTLGDVRNFDSVLAAIQICKPDIIFHMAAQPLVRYSYEAPLETFDTNIMGTVHVLEAARRVSSVRAIVNVTTDKCYENRELDWAYREDEAMGGYDPYSSSKACSELVTSAYRRSFFREKDIAIASARAGNVIGGGDWAADRLIPDILRAFEKSQPVIIRNPNSIRPWQHVLEPLSGYLVLAEKLYLNGQTFAEGWNFGPHAHDACDVRWIVDYLVNTWGRGVSWNMSTETHPHEAGFLKLDISKAMTRLNWYPKWDLKTALEKIIDWHISWLDGGDVQSKCLQQIDDYQYPNRNL